MSETRDCLRCKGSGIIVRDAFSYEGKNYPERRDVCVHCNGQKVFSAPNEESIIRAITTGKGEKHRIRASMTSTSKGEGARAYYVWRLARFHGSNAPGAQCMPVMADIAISGDPFKAELDALADKVAERYFGTSMRAAMRWGRALGMI